MKTTASVAYWKKSKLESDVGQPEGAPAASCHSSPETTDQPSFLSGFTAQVAAYAGRFDAQHQTLMDAALQIAETRKAA